MIRCSEQLEHDPTALDWSKDGQYIVAGDRNGMATVFKADTLEVIGQHASKKAGHKHGWIEDIKWSPNSKMFAYGTHGGVSNIEVGQVKNGKVGKKLSKGVGISSALSHLDWTQDGSTVAVNS